MRISQLGDDAISLHFVPFALMDLAKEWLYNLAENSITSWDTFVRAFLKKFYPIHKTALMRKNISSASKNLTNYFENISNVSNTFVSNALIMS